MKIIIIFILSIFLNSCYVHETRKINVDYDVKNINQDLDGIISLESFIRPEYYTIDRIKKIYGEPIFYNFDGTYEYIGYARISKKPKNVKIFTIIPIFTIEGTGQYEALFKFNRNRLENLKYQDWVSSSYFFYIIMGQSSAKSNFWLESNECNTELANIKIKTPIKNKNKFECTSNKLLDISMRRIHLKNGEEDLYIEFIRVNPENFKTNDYINSFKTSESIPYDNGVLDCQIKQTNEYIRALCFTRNNIFINILNSNYSNNNQYKVILDLIDSIKLTE